MAIRCGTNWSTSSRLTSTTSRSHPSSPIRGPVHYPRASQQVSPLHGPQFPAVSAEIEVVTSQEVLSTLQRQSVFAISAGLSGQVPDPLSIHPAPVTLYRDRIPGQSHQPLHHPYPRTGRVNCQDHVSSRRPVSEIGEPVEQNAIPVAKRRRHAPAAYGHAARREEGHACVRGREPRDEPENSAHGLSVHENFIVDCRPGIIPSAPNRGFKKEVQYVHPPRFRPSQPLAPG